jgi:hypothetical protein
VQEASAATEGDIAAKMMARWRGALRRPIVRPKRPMGALGQVYWPVGETTGPRRQAAFACSGRQMRTEGTPLKAGDHGTRAAATGAGAGKGAGSVLPRALVIGMRYPPRRDGGDKFDPPGGAMAGRDPARPRLNNFARREPGGERAGRKVWEPVEKV